MKSKKYIVLGIAVLLASREAHADDAPPLETAHIVHLQSQSDVTTQGGSRLTLPPGYWLDEQTWSEKDAEFKRLQGQETNLVAQNKSLKASADEFSFGWKTLSTIAVLAFTGGYMLGR